MKGRIIRNTVVSGVILVSAVLLAGCAGNRGTLYDQYGGEMVRSDLDVDSIPVAPEPESYYIGYGDVLDINFLYETKYARTDIKVRPDGRITFPLAGEIFVAGMSPAGLDSVLTERYSEIVVDPRITVIVKDFSPQKVYVLGEVKMAGDIEYERGMTVTQALAEASSFTDEARKTNVLVIRRVAEDHIVGIEVNLEAVLSKGDFTQDIPLKPYDIVYLPKSRIATIEQFVDRMGTIIGEPVSIYLDGWRVANIQLYYDYYSRVVSGGGL